MLMLYMVTAFNNISICGCHGNNLVAEKEDIEDDNEDENGQCVLL